MDPNWLFITWELSNLKKPKEKPKQIKRGNYKLIERDRNGKIINQEIVLSNNN